MIFSFFRNLWRYIKLRKDLKLMWRINKKKKRVSATRKNTPQTSSIKKNTRRGRPRKRTRVKKRISPEKTTLLILFFFFMLAGCGKRNRTHTLKVIKQTVLPSKSLYFIPNLKLVVRRPVVDKYGNHKILIYDAENYENKN